MNDRNAFYQDQDEQGQLLVYRGNHYCTNSQFVRKFQKLYLHDCPELIEHPLVHSNDLVDCQTALKRMELFVKHISKLNVEEAIMKKRLAIN